MGTQSIETNNTKIFLNTVSWGFVLWLFGYILGFIFFAFMPKDLLGWFIMPFGIALTLWVLFKRIRREMFLCYFGIGLIWTVMAIVLDYIFLVKMLNALDYYKLDVYLYYILTFTLPPLVGWFKFYFKKTPA